VTANWSLRIIVVLLLGVVAAGAPASVGRPGGFLWGVAAAHETGNGSTPSDAPKLASDLTVTTLGGEVVPLADFRGGLVLLNLWATWCAPCIREMPSLDRLQAQLGHDVTVLAVSEDRDGSEAVAKFLAKVPMAALTPYLDRQNILAQALEVQGLPATFIIDREGRIRARLDEAAEWDSPEMVALLRELAAAPGATVKKAAR
jgi:thiol-disulfide isomerase/thioredoxin